MAAVTHSQTASQTGAVHAESRAEDDKDTRAVESSYLARGLAERVAQLEVAATRLATLKLRDFGPKAPIAPTALIALESDDIDQPVHYFLTPVGGGLLIVVGGIPINTLTPQSPLGQALIGNRTDDEIEFESPKGMRSFDIVSVH